MVGYDSWHWEDEVQENLRVLVSYDCGTLVTKAPSPEREALTDIAYDCGTLEAAQRRAKEALEGRP